MAEEIKILLVDDIADVRENVRKLLGFEQDFKVVGSTGTGREGIKLAKELKPDIIIMDINMPDIDGITATQEIKNTLQATGVIMMSVNSDRDYMRRAMTAGASDFLTKPANMDDLYATIRHVYKVMEPQRRLQKTIESGQLPTAVTQEKKGSSEGQRAGNVIVCYSPKGGVGTTTIATNVASSLMNANTKVLLVDADVQFGDVGVFLNVKATSTLLDLVGEIEDLDYELFENIVVTHPSGLKVLLGPQRPEDAENIFGVPRAAQEIIENVRYHYDYVIVDTACRLDEVTISLCDIATMILLVTTPTLPSIRETRYVLDLFDQIYADTPNKIKLVLSQYYDEKRGAKLSIPQEQIVKHLKREVFQMIPSEEKPLLQAIIRGIPIVATEKDKDRTPATELIQLAGKIRTELGGAEDAGDDTDSNKNSGGALGWLRR